MVKGFGGVIERDRFVAYLRPVGDRLFFYATDGVHGYEPWVSDGTDAGTLMLSDVSPGASSSIRPETVLAASAGDRVYFRAVDGVHNNALWLTDGTAEGTRFVAEIAAGAVESRQSQPFYALDGHLFYFMAYGTPGPLVLWRTDGTEEGTRVVLSGLSSWLPGLAARDGSVYIPFNTGTSNPPLTPGTLYRNDGTADGMVPLRTFLPASNSSPAYLIAGAGGVYFVATSETGRDLWVTDGTAAGTVLAHDVPEGAPAEPIRALSPFGGTMWFTVEGKLWFTRPPPSVVGRHVFYNRSGLDGNHAGANASDDGAIAANKQALLPGQSASSATVTSYSRGMNGVMVDIAGLASGVTLTAADFVLEVGSPGRWRPLPTTPSVTVRRGAGVSGTDRVALVLSDGAVTNTWLRVTVTAGSRTGLAAPDIFYFGNLIGDAGGPGTPAVNAVDLAGVRAAFGSTDPSKLSRYDFNRDGVVNAIDVAEVRRNQRRTLPLFTAPAAAVAGANAASAGASIPVPSARAPAAPRRRGIIVEPPLDLLA